MKETPTPGFTSIAPSLRQAKAAAKESMKLKIDSAIKIASLVLVAIDDKRLEKFLNLPASLKEETFLLTVFNTKEMPELSLLSCIILGSIERYQKPGDQKPRFEDVRISKKNLFEVFTPGKRFEDEFKEIETATNGFIKIKPFTSTTNDGYISFSTLCDHTKDFQQNTVPA